MLHNSRRIVEAFQKYIELQTRFVKREGLDYLYIIESNEGFKRFPELRNTKNRKLVLFSIYTNWIDSYNLANYVF